MYSNRFVISVLVNGQVQKEFANGEVHLPFGTEYAIRFRNKNNRRAVVKLFIDGEKMCRGGFVIPANTYRDIECSSQTLRKFKFVDLQSTEAQDHGKDQSNAEKRMGLIEAHWYLEKERPVVKEIHHHHNHPVPYPMPYPVPRPWPYRPYDPWLCSNDAGGTRTCSVGDAAPASMPPSDVEASTTMDFDAGEAVKGAVPSGHRRRYASAGGQHTNSTKSYREICKSNVVRDGATVEGDHSNQRFGECNVDIEDHATVLKIYLRGYDPKVEEWNGEDIVPYTAEQGVEQPVEFHPFPPGDPNNVPKVEARYCDKCGAKILKKSSNFCHVCGNKLG